MKQLEVQIGGQPYVLACPEGGEALLQAAVQAVDAEMTAIRDAGKVRSRERMAVLAALNLAYRLAEGGAAATPEAGIGGEGRRTGATGARIDAQIDALLARVDAALGEDGQLL